MKGQSDLGSKTSTLLTLLEQMYSPQTSHFMEGINIKFFIPARNKNKY